jgi:hypothetical protein
LALSPDLSCELDSPKIINIAKTKPKAPRPTAKNHLPSRIPLLKRVTQHQKPKKPTPPVATKQQIKSHESKVRKKLKKFRQLKAAFVAQTAQTPNGSAPTP